MKIAVASIKGNVSEHFGHCELFLVFDIDGKTILRRSELANPEHKPGFLPLYLGQNGIDVVLTGGVGASAIERFGSQGMKVVSGAAGPAEAAVIAFLEGTLQSVGATCAEHQHRHGDGCGQLD